MKYKWIALVLALCICLSAVCVGCGNNTPTKTYYAVTYPSQQAYREAMGGTSTDGIADLFASAKAGDTAPLGDFSMLAAGYFRSYRRTVNTQLRK